MLGISNAEFDDIMNRYIASAKEDLKSVGIASSLVDEAGETVEAPNTANELVDLIETAIVTYVQVQFEVELRDQYQKAYDVQKDNLRKKEAFQETVEEE